MSLEKKITDLRADVQSDRLSMSIGELAGLYERQELDIHPKFQRILRWSNGQKTKLIESLLLRIPIPPIFVSQASDGRWDVVDGVQRLGTIFEFLGILRNPDGTLRPSLKLSATVLLPEVEGLLFNSEDTTAKVFTTAQKLDFRRSRLDIHIVLKESTPSSKYELFERLNTGGSIASPQEVRNCVLVWMNESLFDWMSGLCGDLHYKNSIPLSERLEDEQFRMELFLRFIILHKIHIGELRNIKDLGEFLNVNNRSLASSTNINLLELQQTFQKTFLLLDDALSDDAFRRYDPNRNKFLGPFLISAFEAIAMGVAYNIRQWETIQNSSERINEKIKSLWSHREFLDNIGVGVSANARMPHTIQLGRTHFVP